MLDKYPNPTLTYVIGGKDYTMEPWEWMYSSYNKHDNKTNTDTSMCRSTIMHLNMRHEQFLLGNHFMNKYYVVFDRD